MFGVERILPLSSALLSVLDFDVPFGAWLDVDVIVVVVEVVGVGGLVGVGILGKQHLLDGRGFVLAIGKRERSRNDNLVFVVAASISRVF